MLPRSITVLGLLAICLGASSESSCSFGGIGGGGSSDDPDFVTQLRLENANGEITDSFASGDEINLVLTVRNRLRTEVTVDFTSSRTSDFVVVRENSSDVVWKWSTGRSFTPVQTTLTFAADETKTFAETWNQVGDNGVQVRPGTYEARGVLFYDGFDTNPLRSNQLGSTLVRFTIR